MIYIDDIINKIIGFIILAILFTVTFAMPAVMTIWNIISLTPKKDMIKHRRRKDIATLLLGLLLKGTAEKLSGSSAFIGVMLMITGGELYAAGRFSRREKSEKDISLLDVILVGLAQALAVLPGLSRSGLTISAGLLRGFPKRFAVKFSFLLSVPAVIGASLISLVEAVRLGFDVGLLPMYLAGMAAAAVSGYFAIRLLRWITSRGSIGGFAYYCWGAGIVSILLSLVA